MNTARRGTGGPPGSAHDRAVGNAILSNRNRALLAIALLIVAVTATLYTGSRVMAWLMRKAGQTGTWRPARPVTDAIGGFSEPAAGLAARWHVSPDRIQRGERFVVYVEFRNVSGDLLAVPTAGSAVLDARVVGADGQVVAPLSQSPAAPRRAGCTLLPPGEAHREEAGGGPDNAAVAANLVVGRRRWVLPPGRYELRGTVAPGPADEMSRVIRQAGAKLWAGRIVIPPVPLEVSHAGSRPAEAPASRPSRLEEAPPPAGAYAWLARWNPARAIRSRIAPPRGYQRVPTKPGGFAHWLRHLPLKPGRPAVRLHDGRTKPNQDAHVAVVDLDVGRKDLQQCADTIIRLRAEYLYSHARRDEIRFHFTSGDLAEYAKWAQGYRPVVRGSKVRWSRSGRRGETYQTFRAYLECVFMYAGTLSLSRELRPVTNGADVRIGDVFLRGGSPGHAVIVVDLAAKGAAGGKAFLLAQGFLPAQEMHVLKNPNDAELSPWYPAAFGETLRTPEYTFRRGERMRFP